MALWPRVGVVPYWTVGVPASLVFHCTEICLQTCRTASLAGRVRMELYWADWSTHNGTAVSRHDHLHSTTTALLSRTQLALLSCAPESARLPSRSCTPWQAGHHWVAAQATGTAPPSTVSPQHRTCLERHQQPAAVHPATCQVGHVWPFSCPIRHVQAQRSGCCSPAGVGVRQMAACGLIGVGQGKHWGLGNDGAVCEVACRSDIAEQVELDVFPLVQEPEAAQH